MQNHPYPGFLQRLTGGLGESRAERPSGDVCQAVKPGRKAVMFGGLALSRPAGYESRAFHAQEFADVGDEGAETLDDLHGQLPPKR